MKINRRHLLTAASLVAIALAVGASGSRAETSPAEIWADLAKDVFKGRTLEDGTGLVALDAPYRAEDAALVPVTISLILSAEDPRRAQKLWLIVDENPAPVVGMFEIGEKSGLSSLATRIRVNSYSNVHVVAELSDGKLYAVAKYVKAAGGCAAPATKRMDEAEATLGQMRFRALAQPANASARTSEAVLMIRHPNNSGLQMDQVSHLYTPARFVEEMKIWQGEDLILAMEGGISISEDPNFRFSYLPSGAGDIRVRAVDTTGKVFEGSWPAGKSST